MEKNKKILILTSGKASKLNDFPDENITKASFGDIWFLAGESDLKIGDTPLSAFDAIYFRMVGRSLEAATLVVRYAAEKGIKIVDRIYEKSLLLPLSLGKSIEIRKLAEAKIKMPKTVFNNFEILPFPFVVKSTTGQRGREVWKVENKEQLDELKMKFEKGKFYFAQEFIPGAKRIRVLVVGNKVLGAIVRQTKWNRDETKETLNPVPDDVRKLALDAARASGLDICGVDILVNEKGEMFVIEANAAPSWKLINKYCGVKVEDEIIKFIQEEI